jgi:hypothetical protein
MQSRLHGFRLAGKEQRQAYAVPGLEEAHKFDMLIYGVCRPFGFV